ncbi:MAG: transcription termination factor Rho [Calditrichia bacterium]
MKSKNRKGILEILPEGYGFLRDEKHNFQIKNGDAYVPAEIIRRYKLREGLHIVAEVGTPQARGKSAPVTNVLKCNGVTPEEYLKIPDIKSGISIDPEEQLVMTMEPRDYTGRAMDLFTPVGKGQRGMIISPPKAGKTTILKHIAKAVCKNDPEVEVVVLLIDERPEEVTDFQRDLPGALVFHSSADQDVDNHLRMTYLTMNMAMRRVEFGRDVLILIDSLTRMGRAFNKDTTSGGKTLSGGLAANALDLPRRFFGAARNLENGGSLSIMASILIDTGSRMDEVIFQEFKGTGNLDLVLSRECAERRLFPAINIRHKILSPEDLDDASFLRRKTAGMKPPEALEFVLEYFRQN